MYILTIDNYSINKHVQSIIIIIAILMKKILAIIIITRVKVKVKENTIEGIIEIVIKIVKIIIIVYLQWWKLIEIKLHYRLIIIILDNRIG